MMKSFFKKLSLVMALAMVVSMMAPAASAFAADDLIIAGQKEAKADAKESYSVAVDDEVDFKFYGAAAGWQDLYKWESSDETIAKPLVNEKGEQDGRFEGLKDGEVEVTLTIGEQKATVKLVVGKGNVVVEDNTFTVEQTAANKVAVTFADAAKATDKVELYKIFTTSSGDVEVTWPCKVSVKDGVATVEAYVDFVDGDQFVVKANGESVGFVSYVGPITSIKVIAKTGDKAVTYVNQPIKFEVEYYAGKIKVSPAANSWVTYEALDPNENIYIDSTYGQTSYIYAVGASTRVKAVYSYYDANYNVVEIPYEFAVVGMPVPVEAYDSVDAFTITDQLTDASKVAWGKTELIVGDTGYYVGLNVGTTTDGTYYVNAPIKDKTAYPANLGVFSFQSSDETKLLVGDDGYVTAISDGNAVIIVKLTTIDANGNATTKNVYAFNVTLKPARKATTIKLDKTSVSVLTADNAAGTLTAGKVAFEVVDQYGKTWEIGSGDVEVTTTAKNVPALSATCTAGKGEIAITGTDYATANVSSVLYTLKVKNTNVAASFNVIPKKPAANDGVVVTTGYAVESKGLDVNVKAEDITKNGSNVFYAAIDSFTTWAGTKTGYVANLKYFQKNDKYFTENRDGLKAGDLVLKVTGPDGKLVEVDTANGVKVATVASGAAIDTIKAGTYVVTLYSVTNVTANTGAASGSSLIAHRQVASTTFEVKNTCTQMSVKEYKQGLASDATTAEGVVADIVSFKLGDKDFADSASDITKVTGVYNKSAGKVFVQSIKIKTPINDTGCYFEQTINIGKTFSVTADLSYYNFK